MHRATATRPRSPRRGRRRRTTPSASPGSSTGSGSIASFSSDTRSGRSSPGPSPPHGRSAWSVSSLPTPALGHRTDPKAPLPPPAQDRLDDLAALGPAGFAAKRAPRLLSAMATPAEIARAREAMAEMHPGGYRQAVAMLAQGDLLADAGAVAVPTLVLSGAEDSVTPPAGSRALAAAIAERPLPRDRRRGPPELPGTPGPRSTRPCARSSPRDERRRLGPPRGTRARPGPDPDISPISCCGRRSMRGGGPYSLKPRRRSVGYAFSVLRSVRPATAAPWRPDPKNSESFSGERPSRRILRILRVCDEHR